ncbi:MAG: hypothetical protein ABSD64_07590 [Terriglobales bacterium]
MSKSRLFQVAALIAIVAFLACSQLALAQAKPTPRFHRTVVNKPGTHAAAAVNPDATTPVPPYGLYNDGYWLGQTSYPAVDTNDETLWPCFGSTATPSPDCADIISGGVVVGGPAYLFTLANDPSQAVATNINGCDGDTNGSGTGDNFGTPYIPCAQADVWYEDDANDTTDDQLYSLVVTQGTAVIYDTGTQDWGTDDPTYDGYGGMVPPASIIDDADINFGDMLQTGVNNGNCSQPVSYPVVCTAANLATCGPPAPYTATTCAAAGANCPSNTPGGWPGEDVGWPFVVAAGKKCVAPVAGVATITATTSLAKPTWTYKPNKVASTGGTWTVKYTKPYAYTLAQKWTIYLK